MLKEINHNNQPFIYGKSLLEVLEFGKFSANFVGGCVRDHLLGIYPSDIDIAINASPDKVMEYLKLLKITCIPTGIKYGSVTAIYKGASFEITSLRKDIESDGRHSFVAFGESFEGDAKRRDFTINAIYMDKNERIFDLVGGVNDLSKRSVKFIGNPNERIKEDFLRVWRYFRFLTRFGNIKDTLDINFKEYEYGLRKLSIERVQKELLLWMNEKNTAEFVKIAASNNLFNAQFGNIEINLSNLYAIENIKNTFSNVFYKPSALCKLFVLFSFDFLKKNLKLSRNQIKYINFLNSFSKCENAFEVLHESCYSNNDLRLFWDWIFLKCITNESELKNTIKRNIDKENKLKEENIFDYYEKIVIKNIFKKFPIKGGDLIGKIPTSEIGKKLSELKKVWFQDNKLIF